MTYQSELMDIEPEKPLSEEEKAQKAEYRQRLAEKLKDPGFRKIDGFPIGEDEAILALSDPPYYTACPNPFLAEIIEHWQAERLALQEKLGLSDDESNKGYHREPFAADVSEGKTNPLYRAHSYYTKVPHPAIMRYILHYTDPGDIIFDGFCGTGMAGVAAQLCGEPKEIEKLGYHVDNEGGIYENTGDQTPISFVGSRKSILNDLSPAATFIAYNYNSPVNISAFEEKAENLLSELEQELGWMYGTWHPNCDDPNRQKARIDYTVWSEVLACPSCSQEIIFYEAAFDKDKKSVKKEFLCPHCNIEVQKKDLDLLFISNFDPIKNRTSLAPRRIPVQIIYKIGKRKFSKPLDTHDKDLLKKIEGLPYPDEIPSHGLPDMQMMRVGRMKTTQVSHIHDFFLPRQAQSIAGLWRLANKNKDNRTKRFLLFFVEQAIWGLSILNRYVPTHFSQVNQALSGVFYVASQISEVSPWYNLSGKLKRITSAFRGFNNTYGTSAITCENLSSLNIPNNSMDYIFTDPPFGENIYYSDLNSLVESWHGVMTAPKHEVIVDRVKEKSFSDYERMMETCFVNYYRSLKPGHWMTVEFHNSKNSIWNAIQQAILNAGFIVADVRVLDKKQKSFQQLMSSNAVKHDLIISAYKPYSEFEHSFSAHAGSELGVWEFVRQHLGQLPVTVRTNGNLESIGERISYLLFDRMVAFHIQKGFSIPLSSADFFIGLDERFPKRDGMYFLPDQIPEYDRTRLEVESISQLALFVKDEKTAIQWLRQQLDKEMGGSPQTSQEIQPKFLKHLHQAKHEILPELSNLLEQNFLQDDSGQWYVPDPNKASDIEKIRNKALLREFNQYLIGKKKLKQFRTEAVRAGFADAWQRKDYETIVQVVERLPETIIQEDPDLLMYYDNANLRMD